MAAISAAQNASLKLEEILGRYWMQFNKFANKRLAADFLPLYARVDLWMMLKARRIRPDMNG